MTETDPLSPAGAYDPSAHRMLSFHDAVARFAAAADTPRAYLERCIERIEALEPAVMAFAFLNLQRAREAADQAGARYKAGKPLGPVDGMPVGIKDLIETYDMPTEFGSELFRGYQPITDAATVRALRQGGAVLVGKTVTVCFGGGDPARTRNPFDTRRTPGGSSSGTAAAVALAHAASRARHPRAGLDHPSAKFLRRLCTQAHLRRNQPPRLVLHGLQHGPCWRVRWHAVRHVVGQRVTLRRKPAAIRRYPGLYGGAAPPAPHKPARLIRLETAGWPAAEPAAKEAIRTVRRRG